MIFAWFTALPRGAKLAIAAVVGVLLAWGLWAVWLGNHDAAVIERHEEGVTAEVERKDEAGDTAARETAAAEKSTVERQNDQARKAADGSDDPLRDGLRALRKGR